MRSELAGFFARMQGFLISFLDNESQPVEAGCERYVGCVEVYRDPLELRCPYFQSFVAASAAHCIVQVLEVVSFVQSH